MPSTPLLDSYGIYLDCSILIDFIDRNQPRYKEAQELLKIFQKYCSIQRLQVYTSAWATTEAHGVLYENSLRTKIPSMGRNSMPPDVNELKKAEQQLNELLLLLQQSVAFKMWPGEGQDSTQVWQLARQIGNIAAIWPNDSIHLAIALQSGCSMFISDDQNLLKKINYCQQHLIEPYRQDALSQIIGTTPPFQAHGVRITNEPQKGEPPQNARQALRQLGFD